MPTSDHEIIQSILAAALPKTKEQRNSAAELLNPRAGTLWVVPRNPEIKTPEEAWNAFEKFGGAGWLQNAHTAVILHGSDSEMKQHLAKVKAVERWPVTGERASADPDNKNSFHMRRTATGWSLVEISETDDVNGVLMTKRLLSADWKNFLVYHVAYTRQNVGDHEELRPFASRFVGFEPVPPSTH
jgi:hypothetical protein